MLIVRIVNTVCRKLSDIPYSPLLLIFVPVGIAGGRAIQEELAFRTMRFTIPFLHYVLFYSLLQLILLASLSIATGKSYKAFAGVVSTGMILAWAPVSIEVLLGWCGVGEPQKVYVYFSSFEWDLIADYQPIGESIVLWFSVALLGFYAIWLTGSVLRMLVAMSLMYASIQILGWLIPIATMAALGSGARMYQTQMLNWIFLIGCAVLYVLLNLKTMLPSVLRLNHALPFGLLAAIGARAVGMPWGFAAIQGGTLFFLAMLTLFANDYFDKEMDERAGSRSRPITKNDLIVVMGCHIALAAQVFVYNKHGIILLVSLMAIWACYHAPSLRMKRIIGIPYLFEGASAAMCFLYGVRHGRSFPKSDDAIYFPLLIFCGFAIGSMIKDYKDIPQDRAAGVETVYTYFSRNQSVSTIHRVVSLLYAVSLATPIVMIAHIQAVDWSTYTLAILGLLSVGGLLLSTDRRRAVGIALWFFCVYLVIFLVRIEVLM